jgi:alkylated DNA repair dioxygenase AlkB
VRRKPHGRQSKGVRNTVTYDLFADEPGTPEKITMPDADVVYFSDFFSPSEANSLLERLKQEVTWQQEKINLYGKVHNVPRLTAWYGDPAKTYIYSGITVTTLEWIDPLLAIKKRIEDVSAYSFNSVLLNRYRNGSDGVSWHADDEPELGQNPVIGSVSLGEVRPFKLKHKSLNEKREIPLKHGSYLLMKGSTQHHWLHEIPKSKKVLNERINLTFRNVC